MITKRFGYVWEWLSKHPLVVVGYFDSPKGIDLIALTGMWLDCGANKDEFADSYPYVADYFQIEVVGGIEEDPRTLYDVLPDFRYCHHLKAWCYGQEVLLNSLEAEK